MQIFGKTLGEYVQFQKALLILTAAVGLLRLALSMAGTPTAVAQWFSVTALVLVGVVYYPIRVHTSGFGTYRHVLILLALQLLVAELIVAGGIAITAVTGAENIYSIPEFSGGGEPNHWFHAATHLVGGPTIFAVILWLPASLIMFVTRRVAKSPAPVAG